MQQYTPPGRNKPAFHCPYCGVFAHQTFQPLQANKPQGFGAVDEYGLNRCSYCGKWAIWNGDVMIYPLATTAPFPAPDMPPDVAEDYNEARATLPTSARASAALLRLAVQKLCKDLGQPGENLNEDIAALVKAGLRPQIQQALDVVRVIGNNAVHPGELDVKDNPDSAMALFGLVNMIVQVMITEPKQVTELYSKLPEGALKAIEKRDSS